MFTVTCIFAALAVAVMAQTPCTNVDTQASTAVCYGATYDLSKMKTDQGSTFFSGSDGLYNYYFQMVPPGLNASFAGCSFSTPISQGNAGGQATSDGGTCWPTGLVSNQQWSIQGTGDSQQINIMFGGGEDQRQTSLVVFCDHSTTGTFTAKGETGPDTKIYEFDIRSCVACADGCVATTTVITTTVTTTTVTTTTTTTTATVTTTTVPPTPTVQCSNLDVDLSTGVCAGETYDFKQMKTADGSYFFSGSADGYNYYFQMVPPGIPSSFPGCTLASGASGYAGSQATADGTSCWPTGAVNQQAWTLVGSGDTQQINILFTGGEDSRTISLVATCDKSTTGIFTAKGETPAGSQIYEYDIQTCAACPGGCGFTTTTTTAVSTTTTTTLTACSSVDYESSSGVCRGQTYDFKQMVTAEGSPFFSTTDGTYNYYFQMKEPGLPAQFSGCTFSPVPDHAAGAQAKTDGSQCWSTGLVNNQQWFIQGTGTQQQILITFTGGQDNRQIDFVATCNPTTTGQFSATESSSGSMVYRYEMQTCAACAGGCTLTTTTTVPSPVTTTTTVTGPATTTTGATTLSTTATTSAAQSKPNSDDAGLSAGSILLIIFFSVTGAYFIFGAVFMKVRRQATGREIIPNVEFWASLPGLVADGFRFVAAKARRQDYTPL